ncbi:hypothetical protein TNCV_3265561 [Trichonephila clavipes]|nr:hypothetical protein TNCV_3265561 [Trichonephila clavipes]
MNLEMDCDDVQELLDSHYQELTINELIEMHEQEQDVVELESLDPVQSEDRMRVGGVELMHLNLWKSKVFRWCAVEVWRLGCQIRRHPHIAKSPRVAVQCDVNEHSLTFQILERLSNRIIEDALSKFNGRKYRSPVRRTGIPASLNIIFYATVEGDFCKIRP